MESISGFKNKAGRPANKVINAVQPVVDIDELSKMIAGNTAEAMAKAMSSFLEKSTERITDKKERAEAKADMKTAVDELRAQERYRIILNEQENTDNPSQQFVSCNGVSWLIKRGVEVVVPEGILNVIKGCVYSRSTQSPDGDIESKKVNRFSYSVLGPA